MHACRRDTIIRPAHRTLNPDGVADPNPRLTAALGRVDAQFEILIHRAFPPWRSA